MSSRHMLKIAIFEGVDRMQYVRAPYEEKTAGEVAIHVMTPLQLRDLAEAIQVALIRLPLSSFAESQEKETSQSH